MSAAFESEGVTEFLAALICRLFSLLPAGGIELRKKVIYYTASLLFRRSYLTHAKFFVSAGLSQYPDSGRLNSLNVAISRAGATPNRDDCGLVENINTCCMVLGPPGSGHTLLAALLDAHPDVAISNDLNVAKQLKLAPSRETLLRMMVEQARTFAFSGWYWRGRSHAIMGQWQGSYNGIRVIGDKLTPGREVISATDPAAIGLIEQKLGLPVKIIHTFRNPFHSISEMAHDPGSSLERLMNRHFLAVEAISTVKFERPEDTVLDLSYERLLEDPRGSLARLCAFLNLPAAPDYLESCARVVSASPVRSPKALNWTERQKARVQKQLEIFPWLEHYNFG